MVLSCPAALGVSTNKPNNQTLPLVNEQTWNKHFVLSMNKLGTSRLVEQTGLGVVLSCPAALGVSTNKPQT
jgi:hypothetical protein